MQELVHKCYAILYRLVPAGVRLRTDAEHFSITRFMEYASGEVRAEDKVLDAGAGGCPYRPFFDHAHYESTDQNDPRNQHTFTCNLDSIPQPENTYDVVVCCQVIHQAKYPQKILQEFARVLKPGGKLFLVEPQGWGLVGSYPHYYNFTKYALDLLMRDSGFDVVFVRPRGGIFWYLSSRFKLLPGYIFFQYMPRADNDIKGWPRYVLAFLLLPFYVIGVPLCKFILPLLLFYLDPIDRLQDYTLGYACYGTKKTS